MNFIKKVNFLSEKILSFVPFITFIKQIGCDASLDVSAKRRLGIFNLINFTGLFIGVILILTTIRIHAHFPKITWLMTCTPLFISLVVLILNYKKYYKLSLAWYFILYPSITSIVYFKGVDLGIELLYILYGVLAVFFLHNFKPILIAIGFSTFCYLLVNAYHEKYIFVLEEINPLLYLINQIACISFIFFGLLLIKKESNDYQKKLTNTNIDLHKKNLELNINRITLEADVKIQEEQSEILNKLNDFKDKIFFIVSHDLKNPIYSLRNLFLTMQQYNVDGDEIRKHLPAILNDLNYTTSLIDNLLTWAKTQMQGYSISLQATKLKPLVTETIHLLQLQAQAKEIDIYNSISEDIIILTDKDVLGLVLRNLISNAIKFTNNNGKIYLTATTKKNVVEISIEDTGVGIKPENIGKLFEDDYFSTKGTAEENGTGFGLTLCKDFIIKNGGEIFVESEVGKGSKFSFTVAKGYVLQKQLFSN